MTGEDQAASAAQIAFANEAMTHLDHLYRLAFHLARDSGDAEDLVQETFARALAARAQFDPTTNLKAWLSKILYNLFFDHYRSRKRRTAIEDGARLESETWPRTAASSPESEILRKELDEQITRLLRQIPEEFRAAIVLVDIGDFSYEEVAGILSCPVGTIRSRLSRGRKLMQQYLKGYLGEGSDRIPRK